MVNSRGFISHQLFSFPIRQIFDIVNIYLLMIYQCTMHHDATAVRYLCCMERTIINYGSLWIIGFIT